MRPTLCKHTRTSYALCERKRQIVIKSIRSLRAKCTRYINRFLEQAFANSYQVRQRLEITHGLRKDKKKKPVLHAKDEFELLKTLYTSIEMTFRHERYRVQLGGMMQLARITGNRPGALLAIRYRHIKVTLLPNLDGEEQPQVLIEIIFPNTKGYLEEKDA